MAKDLDAGGKSYLALNGMKFLVPIIILTSHWADELGSNPLRQSQLSIDFFFAIEGFLAAETLRREGSGKSFLSLFGRQLLKIYPIYLLSIIISVVLNTYVLDPDGTELGGAVMTEALKWNVFLLPILTYQLHVFPLNPPVWAIALEVYAFAFLILTKIWIRMNVLVSFFMTATFCCMLISFLARNPNMGFDPQSYWGGFPRCLFGFFFGVLLCNIFHDYGSMVPRINPLYVWAAFLAVMFPSIRYISLPLLLIFMPLIMIFAVTATNPPWLRGIANQAARIAYAVYLLGYPILIGMHHILGSTETRNAESLFMYYVILLATVIFSAYVATRVLELCSDVTMFSRKQAQ